MKEEFKKELEIDDIRPMEEYVGCKIVGSTQVPFLMCALKTPQKFAAQVLALNHLLSLLLSFLLKLSFSQTKSFSCIFVFASSFIHLDLSIIQTQHR